MVWMTLLACGGGPVPTSPAQLLPFLEAGDYLGWASERAVHPSAGPHFGDVLTFVNPVLEASLDAGDPSHPVDAAAVKELYGGTEPGWSVMVKVDEGDTADTWYWYEFFDGEELIAAKGAETCAGCHSGGIDHVLTPWPLL